MDMDAFSSSLNGKVFEERGADRWLIIVDASSMLSRCSLARKSGMGAVPGACGI